MARIMIVDDSMVMRRNLKRILVDAGHEVVAEASNGREAWGFYQKFTPTMVTMDINMPEMDGIKAVKKIKEIDPSAIIIMISAHNEQSRVYEAIKAGAVNYVVKPINAEKVIQVIDSALAKAATPKT